jgi:hypothetical protein
MINKKIRCCEVKKDRGGGGGGTEICNKIIILFFLTTQFLFAENETKQIFVKVLSGKHITLYVELTGKVKVVKEKINEKEGIPVSQQILIFEEKLLEDDNSLEFYGITKDSTLHLTLKKEDEGESKDFKNLSRSHLVNIANINQATDLISKINSKNNSIFYYILPSYSRYKTESYIDMYALNAIFGVNYNSVNYFFEGGGGSYNTNDDIFGNNIYYGIGAFYNINNNLKISSHFGKTKNKVLDYNGTFNYFGGSIEQKINTFILNYSFNRISANTINNVNFSSIVSNKIKVGKSFNFIKLYYEYEFSANSKVFDNMGYAKSSLKGGNFIAEFSKKIQLTKNLKLYTQLEGFYGIRNGVSGAFKLSYSLDEILYKYVLVILE